MEQGAVRSRAVSIGIVCFIALIALALRVWGAGWSLPYVDHPDEPAVVRAVLRIVKGDFNPKHFFYPSLMLYLQALVFKLHFVWGTFTGLYPELFVLPNSTFFYTTIPQAFLWSRVTTALIGTGTVLALALWGGVLVGRWEGMLAAALLACSSWAIIHDHYITVDGPSACTGTLALLGALGILRRGSWRDYVLAGVLVGLAAGTKYQNVLVAASVMLAHILLWKTDSLRTGGRLVVAGLLSALVFLATTPYIILGYADFMHDIRTLFESYSSTAIAHGDATGAWPVGAYLRFYWREGLQPVPCVLALVGAVVLVRRSPAHAAVLVFFPLLLVFSLLRPETHFFRNLLPTLPPLFILAGVGGVSIITWVASRLARGRAVVQIGIATILLLPSLVPAVQASARLALPDSRVVAQNYIRQHWPGVRVASELSHPLQWDGVAQASFVHYLPLHPPAWYHQQGYGLLLANAGRRKSEAWTPDYAPLLHEGQEVATFGGQGTQTLGPLINIVDTRLTTETLPTREPHVRLGPLDMLGVVVGRIEKDENGPWLEADRTIKPGRVLGIDIFWLAPEAVPQAPYTIFLHMRDGAGRTIVQRDAPPWQGLFPPETWPAGQVVSERVEMWLPYEVPPGTYHLVMGLYDSSTMARFPAFAGETHLENDEIDLGEVEVVAW